MITKNKQLQRIVKEYQKEGHTWPATADDLAEFAVETKRYDLTAPSLKRLIARELAQAMRTEYFIDKQGRRVRAKHPARVKKGGLQLMLWDDIRTAPRRHMENAFQLRRRRITSECKQVKTDVDSYNDAHREELPIQMVLDFTKDVEELELEAEAANYSSSNEPVQHSEHSLDVALGSV